MIEVQGLTKYYGRLAAVKDVSFTIETGSVVGFLGPNGAGKTTTMRILTCYSPPSSGSIKILGLDVSTDSMKIREHLGYLPENVPLYDWMRVRGYLEFVCRAKGVRSVDAKKEVERVTEAVGLVEVTGKIIKWLSKGFRQRLGLAQALIGDPPVIILDEPTIGLDPRQIREIRSLIKGLSKDKTVILSTHILPEVSQICDRVIIINKGKLVAEDTPSNLTASRGSSSLCRIRANAPVNSLKAKLSDIPGVLSVREDCPNSGDQCGLTVEAESAIEVRPSIAECIVSNGWGLLKLEPLNFTLEDVFIDLITEETGATLGDENEESREVA